MELKKLFMLINFKNKEDNPRVARSLQESKQKVQMGYVTGASQESDESFPGFHNGGYDNEDYEAILKVNNSGLSRRQNNKF